ncbi:Pls/PosA family non-ribosomal peptide synthetase [Streptomyces albipurpureus]|uniref:Amino acid adenylation domain-containing protein n=1 Tax=Streptomyces albipurpureus TaxID=2897419 RepID=A0ABT0V277_9ACTN|nr:Pls/PosA family non-ribosomal peptide synthetase [Streptomyces sp. CWNU-1]MCM2393985.1 amino acid adenylation domain-containing protein [Streptomyces sp. CWNU-1]
MTVAPNTPVDPAALLTPLLDTATAPAIFVGGPAAPARTLLDILDETVRRHPDALAVDDGLTSLSYRELSTRIDGVRQRLAAVGIGQGDRVGVRVPSGTADLYVTILGVLAAGAAYVPVDADDPPERAELVFTEAAVSAVVEAERAVRVRSARTVPGHGGPVGPEDSANTEARDQASVGSWGTEARDRASVGPWRTVAVRGKADDQATAVPEEPRGGPPGEPPRPGDDAWIIFTSGSTGRPKGVAVTHRAAAALVDAEARLFLRQAPLGPGDRVLAGLSVAFDASCEEMWLAWRHGACLVPAPRSLVRAGMELGPWLVERRITVVSTVPTLAALWPARSLDGVRLLIFGGEACPPELARRMAVPGREVWNTYGPTETTVVACAAPLTATDPVRIGLPLDGWELAVVDEAGEPVPMGGSGELVIAGVGLARYLDRERDTEKYAPLGALGWSRAYRSGDLVRAQESGLLFLGRVDDQIKLGGRRIELGEIDAALQALPGVFAAAAALRTTASGHQLLVGYVVPSTGAIGHPAELPGTPRGAGGEPVESVAPGEVPPGSEVSARSAASDRVPSGPGARRPKPVPVDRVRPDPRVRVEPVPLGFAPSDPDVVVEPVPSVCTSPDPGVRAEPAPFDQVGALARLRAALPAALVPLLVVIDDLPTRTSGKVDRDALPWPLPDQSVTGAAKAVGSADTTGRPVFTAAEEWLAAQWAELLGTPVIDPEADFFAHGGGSLAAARLVSRIRERHGTGSVADVYRYPRLRSLALTLEGSLPLEAVADTAPGGPRVRPVPRRAQIVQLLLLVPLFTVAALRWSVPAVAVGNALGIGPAVSWWWVALGWLLLFSPPGRIAIAAGGARLLLRGLRPGSHPRGGPVHLRLWTAERLAETSGAVHLTGPWLTWYATALGARVADDADLHALPPVTGWLRLGRGCAIEPEVDLCGHWLDGDRLRIGPVRVGAEAVVGARSTLFPGARIGKRARIAPGSAVTGAIPAGERWSGAPATREGRARRPREPRPPHQRRWSLGYALSSLVLGVLPMVAIVPALWVMSASMAGRGDITGALTAVPLATVAALISYALLILLGVRALSVGLRAGSHPLHSRIAWQIWATERLMDMARTQLHPLYASLLTPGWLRALGMRVGHGVEASTVLAVPAMTSVGSGAFLADDTMVGGYELGGGRLRIAAARVGKRAFLGNSGMTAAGRRVPKRGLVGVLSAAPKRSKAGSSWLGMPPMELPRAVERTDESRTFSPPRRLKWARGAVELCRIVPLMCGAALAVSVLALFGTLATRWGHPLALLVGGLLLLGAGAIASTLAIAAKWLLVGVFRVGEHPLWSGSVWRDELADTFVETLAVPWLMGAVPGTPLTILWLRGLGARIGPGVWCETYWLPEPDLVSVGGGASVNRGCVVQTHLFHDRIMRLDAITLGTGTSLGPHSIALPGVVIGDGAVVGPGSLVMSGERVPAGTRWLGNPIAAWRRPSAEAPPLPSNDPITPWPKGP